MARKQKAEDGDREFVGLKGNWMNAQHGDPGKVRAVRGEAEKKLLTGVDPFNGDFKNKVIANLTPRVKDEDGNVHDLYPGDAENEQVEIDYYAVIFDGKRYEGDDIMNSPIVVNNMDANYGLTPRLVFGPGIDGHHTFSLEVSVNGHKTTLRELRIG